MPRVNRVKKARKDQGSCGKCGEPILAGDPYIWAKPRYGGKRVRCVKYHACRFRPSQLTSSEIKGTIYGAQEDWEDRADAHEMTPLEVAQMVAEACREAVELFQEKMDAIEEGMGHTEGHVWLELEERLNELEPWVEELRELVEEWEGYQEDEEEEDEDERDWVEEFTDLLNECPE